MTLSVSRLQELIEWCEFVLETLDGSEKEQVRKIVEESGAYLDIVQDFYDLFKDETEAYEVPDISKLGEDSLAEAGKFIEQYFSQDRQ